MDFVQELWGAILQPGVNPALVKATHGSFIALLITLIGLFFATHSIHFAILTTIAGALWATVTWFISELENVKVAKQVEGDKDNAIVTESETKNSKSTATRSATQTTKPRSKKI